MTKEFDVLVVGGGPAGYSAAIWAARSGKSNGIKVALVESRQLGGTCLNRGCIPTKTLLETARLLDLTSDASQRGIEFEGQAKLNPPKAFQFKDRIAKRMSTGVGVLLRENGIQGFSGTANVDKSGDSFFVTIADKNGNSEKIIVKKLVLAAGSQPSRVSVQGLDNPAVAERVFDSDDFLDIDVQINSVPKSLAILGGGVIGVEMARIFKSFGSEVHLIEAMSRLLPLLDIEVSEALRKSLVARKISISVDDKLERVERPEPEGELLLHLESGKRITASHLLVAVGRSPKTDSLSPELLAKLKPDKRGFIPVNADMETSVSGLYAPGDINGKCMLAHAAIEMGRVAAEAAVESLYPSQDELEEVNESAIEEYRRRIMEKTENSLLPDQTLEFFPFYVPGCIYGEPEIGFIGWTEEEARKKLGDQIQIGRFPFAANGRASSSGHRDGFVKVIRFVEEQKIVGVHIVGPCASELINEVSAVIHAGGNIEQWAASIHAHPTYGEALVEAAADSFGLALHLPPKSQ